MSTFMMEDTLFLGTKGGELLFCAYHGSRNPSRTAPEKVEEIWRLVRTGGKM